MTDDVVESIINGIGKQLSNKFEELRPLHYNTTTKGHGYEIILKDILDEYLESIVSTYTNCALIDRRLDFLDNLDPRENEWDVVAVYNSACPRIVLQKNELKYIPLDGVAFLVEVKQTLTKPYLLDDLSKFYNISNTNTDGRFGATFTGPYSVGHPIKILAYYDKSIDNDIFFQILHEQSNCWDFVLLVKDDILYVNPSLPWVDKRWTEPEIEKFHPHALFWLVLILSISFTISPLTNTAQTFVNMWQRYYDRPVVN